MANSEERTRSIFELADVFDYRSPFRSDWIQAEKEAREIDKERESTSASRLSRGAKPESMTSITVPLVSPAPKGKMPISDFIDLIRKEEDKYPLAERSNTKLMVTRLRKIFYNTPNGWDKYLIPKAASIAPPYAEYRDRVRSRKRVEPWGVLNNFNLVDKEHYPVDSDGKRPQIYLNQEVVTEEGPTTGAFIDMGHVFAGWDAFNNPGPVVAPLLSDIKINRNWDAATWVGDLGSVLAEAWVAYVNGEQPLSTATLQHLIDEYAPAQDMLGNIDSYVFATQGFTGMVSEILTQYYSNTDPRKLQAKRFTIFAQELGIGPLENGRFRNSGTRAQYHWDEITDSAALYIAAAADPPNLVTRFMARGGILSTMADDRTASVLYEGMIRSLLEAAAK